MKKLLTTRTLALATSVALALGCAPAFAAQLRMNERPVEGRYIVVLKENAARLSSEANGKARVADVARSVSAGHGAKLLRSYEHALRGFVVDADDRALAKLLADPRVAYVEQDGFVSANATQSPATWGLDRVDQRNLPLDNAYTYTTTATGVHAYIIDTGMLTTHSQFGGRIGNGFDAVGGGVTDCNGHGTHVAGTVGGATWGVTKGTTLHPVRVLDCSGFGTWSGVIAGIDWVRVNHVKPAVANMSLGGGANASVDAATDNRIAAGVTVVVAAGNDYGGDACAKSPARVAAAITVGSTDSNDARSGFSNVGTCLDLFAPGGGITSAWHTGTTASNTISGTSMASPHVAGAAALYLADNPNASPATVRNALVANATPNKVANAGAGSPNLLLYTISSAPPQPGCGVLASGASLPTGGSKTSCDGRFTFVIQGDGNLVLYQAGVGAIWANYVFGTGHTLHMQGDGNLVVYNNVSQARWHTSTWGQPGAWLAVQNDGNVVVYSASGQALWNTGTWGR
ncbi:MAG: S8 family serine peptidase [Lysobacter sp.]|nr:S8 family serine peptidase [Lysobacter sp.]